MEFKDAVKAAMDIHRDEAKDLSETWRHLDAKAQGVNTIAGVFLAALFAWSRDGHFLPYDKAFYIICVLCLLGAVAAAVLAMRVTQVMTSATSKQSFEMLREIMATPESQWNARATGFVNDYLSGSFPANEEMRKGLVGKGRWVQTGQAAIVIAILVFAYVVFRRILVTS